MKNGEEKRKRKAGDEKEEREKIKLMDSTQKGVARKHGWKRATGTVKMNDSSEKWKKDKSRMHKSTDNTPCSVCLVRYNQLPYDNWTQC